MPLENSDIISLESSGIVSHCNFQDIILTFVTSVWVSMGRKLNSHIVSEDEKNCS